ncbi:MAG: PstS family phosphate ABC transporter substrate-binding protein [Campylobacterales bacterium]
MKAWKKVLVSATAVAAFAGTLEARDQIKIVGSSTVYPFSSYVAEELGATTKFPTPVIESTGSGGGMKLFCEGNGLDTPDFTNASRAMKEKEFKTCQENGVTDITGAIIGYDGIAIAQSKVNPDVELTREELLLAVASDVPGKDGKLIANPYKKWSDINPKLPNREIKVYGPPATSGTRDAFEELVMEKTSKTMDAYGKKKYSNIRQDGVYVPSGENDNLIVQKLVQDKAAIGIFGYSFLEENSDKIKAAKVDGYLPTPETVSSGVYPVSRSLFFYIKNSHKKDVPAMDAYIKLFMSEQMIGDKGVLKTIGLIPLGKDLREKAQKSVLSGKKLTLDMVKNHTVVK